MPDAHTTPLRPPEPALADDAIRLEPLTQADVPGLLALTADPEIRRFTRVPDGADEAWVRGWIRRYEHGWSEGDRAGFAIRGHDGDLLGFAALVELDLDTRESEIGYMVAPAARGRGVASRAVRLLTEWGLDQLGLARLELRIDPANTASTKVAERAGYHLDGVLRSVHFKDGVRGDLGVWSRLGQD
ncbi:MAG: hypothetical protein QOH95_688 [Gaiellaceae bacterium]|nr:hypothetical protein [Gaiellaceae bacterium]